jgi:cytochrome c biogenesis protein CcdA/glutaredoxin
MKRAILLSLFLILIIPQLVSSSNNEIDVHLFYGEGCPHCAASINFLDSLQAKYPTLTIHKHEVYFNDQERELFERISSAYDTEIQGVPTIFIDEYFIAGFNNQEAENIELIVENCLDRACINPEEKTPGVSIIKTLTIPALISAAIVDAINPCAFAVLIILVSTILASKKRKKALFAGIAFSLAIFISYLLMGIGLYSAIQAAGITHIFFWIVAILAILLGLFNLKDYLWYGKWFVAEVPLGWRPKMKSIIKGVTSVPGAFLVGFLVSLFLLPCTSGPYIVVLGLLAKATTRLYAFSLLILYNLIFILPMLLITLAIYFGFTTAEKAEELRKKKLRFLHLIAGIIILLLGIGMILSLLLGLI